MKLRISQTIVFTLQLTLLIEECFCQICEFLDERSLLFSRLQPRMPNYFNVECELMFGMFAGISVEPITRVTTVDKKSTATFSCVASWPNRRSFLRRNRLCDLAELQFESQDALVMQLALAVEWKIDQMGPFNSTESLTSALTERGVSISTTCSLHSEELFDLLQDEDSCQDRIISDVLPHCVSLLNITREESNNNVRLQCSVRPLQCEDGRFIDRSSVVYLRLQGMWYHV